MFKAVIKSKKSVLCHEIDFTTKMKLTKHACHTVCDMRNQQNGSPLFMDYFFTFSYASRLLYGRCIEAKNCGQILVIIWRKLYHAMSIGGNFWLREKKQKYF